MDILFLIILLAILIIPSFLMSRRQRAKMSEIHKLQESLVPGDRVVTTSGQHATVVTTTPETVDLEIAPGVRSTFEKLAVVRILTKAAAPQIVAEENLERDIEEDNDGRGQGHPENL